ncbi:carboxylesterase [Jeotgalicoccus coquinae]|uniref:Hydrolase MhqD n=1 Tax=Jeotgalicoccus coquinae TaxID=709509 RepID=A0A6V7RNP9_9STAP|nr:alpha/beta hydrolase [Jeotgalicoccus coquinae]MBB6424011.1 phospholipase/carboxylesterase [Jeotgalicoccus coquinae]GGE23197.1 carboxylesterase [Jeotgalicoccus coquinae]CAD2080093.1 Putative hydrolase MhqD [Jeotgalicoccus coquinae]
MKHLYIKSRTEEAKETLILFHGTGGRETDLLDVATTVNSEANILSLRGDIDENGQTRFFKRLTPKQYDEESLKEEGGKIYAELKKLSEEYNFELRKAVLIGYSNGANIGAYLLLNYDLNVRGAMLMHSAYRSETIGRGMLFDTDVLLTAGAQDMVATAGEAYTLKSKLENKGAEVSVKLTDGGHEISPMELMEGHVWYMPIKKSIRDEDKLL